MLKQLPYCLKKLVKLDKNQEVFNSFLNPKSRQATLPPLLPKKIVDNLSEKSGVYYFQNNKSEIIYVGKANNIKQRVLSHFYDKAKKEVTMCLETSNVTFTETGSELVALLLESAEIKKIFPKYNRAQKRTSESIGLFSYEDRDGIIHLAFNRLKLVSNPLMKFHSNIEVRLFLEKLCEEFELCPKYCHLQSNIDKCFHFQIKKCKGICSEKEAVETYNLRVKKAIESVQFQSENFVIKETGRNNTEFAFVLIINGVYKGFGYAEKELTLISEYLEAITPQKDNNDIKRILNSYLKKNTETVEELKEVTIELDSFNLFAS